MTTKGLAALALVAALAANVSADDPKLPDVKAFDKLVIDALRGAHNKGADLYNEGRDFAGAFRVYQGALMTVQPLLGHRPEAQKLIDTGLEAAEKETDPARKAFLLHEAIEAVRKNLKTANAEPKKVEPPTKPTEEPKKVDPPAKKPDEPKKVTEPPAKPPMPSEEPKAPALPVAPTPREVKPKG